MKYVKILMTFASALVGCTYSLDYVKTHESASTAIPAAVQMEELFGDADHFITHFAADGAPKTWNTEVFFGGRYSLTMTVDVLIDARTNSVKQVGTPKFYLVGADKVTILPDGREMADYAGDEHWLSMADWAKVYASKGDFSKIGISLKSDSVANFDRLVSGIRKDREPIRLIKKKNE